MKLFEDEGSLDTVTSSTSSSASSSTAAAATVVVAGAAKSSPSKSYISSMIMSVTTAKMTGLDLGPPPLSNSSSSSSRTAGTQQLEDDDSLTTPKVEPSTDPGSCLPSPRCSSRPSSSQAGGQSSAGGGTGEDMLTTPVLTTPKTAEYWSTLGKDIPFSPTNHLVSVPPPPPRELPMDSDIGLRSPCDGLLHKRRMFKNKINSGNSVNSDSNSCDTPCSADNSPRDLSLSSSVKEEMEKDEDSSSSGGTATNNTHAHSNGSSVSHLRRQISKPSEGLNNKNVVNFQQSPLAVPSPNWNVVDRYIVVESLKTPKLLDNSFFDFLVPPTTPKNGKISGNRDISPGSEADRYSGRDQRLSPRLSPRFPIPEAPTDLSKNNHHLHHSSSDSRIPPLARIPNDEDPYEAEDLSMSKHPPPPINNNNNNNVSSFKGRTPSPPSQRIHSPPSSIQSADHCKEEYSPSNNSHNNHIEASSGKPIKTEMDTSSGGGGLYEYRQGLAGQPAHTAASFPHPLYFPPQFHSALYHRQIYSELQQQQGNQIHLSRASPQMEVGYEGGYQQQQQQQQQHMAQQMGGGSHAHHHSNASLHWSQHLNNAHHWTIPSTNDDSAMEEDNSSSSSPPYHHHHSNGKAGGPPPTISVKPPSALLHNGSSSGVSPELIKSSSSPESKKTPLKKRVKDSSNPSKSPSSSSHRSEKPRSSAKEPGGHKRTYVCPHCQRSYDWNYNLNRHLKYECGKENAFQCSKCSRKFPHKQNCVYHLKRKHKIICDSIDQYVSKGFVIFQGAASASDSPPSSSSNLGGPHLGSSGHMSRESIATSS